MSNAPAKKCSGTKPAWNSICDLAGPRNCSFGAGFGIIYQGERLGSNGARTFAAPDPLILPSFVRVDTAVFYRLNKCVNFAFNIENLFDEVIFVNASVGSNIEIAAPREMTVRTTFNF